MIGHAEDARLLRLGNRARLGAGLQGPITSCDEHFAAVWPIFTVLEAVNIDDAAIRRYIHRIFYVE
jgi:hypothetical protein